MPNSQAIEIEAYLNEVVATTSAQESPDSFLLDEEADHTLLIVPREYQSAITTFESPLMEYIRNLQVKLTRIPKEISFINSIYSLTSGNIINLLDTEKGEQVKEQLFRLLQPLVKKSRHSQKADSSKNGSGTQETQQILNRCYLVLFSNFSQMQSAIIQGIIYDIERQGVHLPIQSSTELDIIAQQYRPIVQNQAVIIRNMFRHLFPEFVPPDNIHVLELCFLGLLEEIQRQFKGFLETDEQLLQMLSRIKVAQDELLNVKDPNLRNVLAKMERVQNQFHDIYNQRWRDGILNDIISIFFYHARFTAYLENKGKISKKRRYFLASFEHLLNNYEDFYNEILVSHVERLMEEYRLVDQQGYTFVRRHILPGNMKRIFQTILDADRFSVLSEMIVTGEFSKGPESFTKIAHAEELEKMRRELRHKHETQSDILSYIDRLWDIVDELQELLVSEIFAKWKDPLNIILNTYYQELFWFHACFSTYTADAFMNKSLLFQELELFVKPYREALQIFSDRIFKCLESLSQQVYSFRDRAGDFNLLYTGILGIELKKEENQFQFELYTPIKVKQLAQRLATLQERYVQSLNETSPSLSVAKLSSGAALEAQKNHRLYTDEIVKTANYLAEEREILMYCGSRKLFTGPQFVEEDFSHYYHEVLDIYEHGINQLQANYLEPLDSLLELKSLRERAQVDVVYERYSEVVKYKALKKAWQLSRKKEMLGGNV